MESWLFAGCCSLAPTEVLPRAVPPRKRQKRGRVLLFHTSAHTILHHRHQHNYSHAYEYSPCPLSLAAATPVADCQTLLTRNASAFTFCLWPVAGPPYLETSQLARARPASTPFASAGAASPVVCAANQEFAKPRLRLHCGRNHGLNPNLLS